HTLAHHSSGFDKIEWAQNPGELKTREPLHALQSGRSETRLRGRATDRAIYIGQKSGQSGEPLGASTTLCLLCSYHSQVVSKSAPDGFVERQQQGFLRDGTNRSASLERALDLY